MPAVPALPWAVWGEPDFAVALSRVIFLGWWGKNPRVIPKRGDGLYQGLCNSACDFLPKKSHFWCQHSTREGEVQRAGYPEEIWLGNDPRGRCSLGWRSQSRGKLSRAFQETQAPTAREAEPRSRVLPCPAPGVGHSPLLQHFYLKMDHSLHLCLKTKRKKHHSVFQGGSQAKSKCFSIPKIGK